jgi:hypothetical protein
MLPQKGAQVSGGIDAVQHDGIVAPVAAPKYVHGRFAQTDAVAHVDVVDFAEGIKAQFPPIEIVGMDAILLVGPVDDGSFRVFLIVPDRRIVGGVLQRIAGHRFGLHHGHEHVLDVGLQLIGPAQLDGVFPGLQGFRTERTGIFSDRRLTGQSVER